MGGRQSVAMGRMLSLDGYAALVRGPSALGGVPVSVKLAFTFIFLPTSVAVSV